MTSLAAEISLLATGFGPFLSHSYNPSWEVARAFSRALGAGYACRAERLDVSFEVARDFADRVYLGDNLAGFDVPELLVHFGLAASSKELKFEGFAYNRRGKTSDSADAGARNPLDGILVVDGDQSYQTRVDVARLSEIFTGSGAALACRVDACVSQDPGDYVCNAIYYHSLRAAKRVRERGGRAEVLFVHVPALESAQAASLGREIAASLRRYLDLDLEARRAQT